MAKFIWCYKITIGCYRIALLCYKIGFVSIWRVLKVIKTAELHKMNAMVMRGRGKEMQRISCFDGVIFQTIEMIF